jgi:hypothetical protein
MSARVVWVRAAIASMLAPLKPRAANSSIAAWTMRARLASGAFGLRIARGQPACGRPLGINDIAS